MKSEKLNLKNHNSIHKNQNLNQEIEFNINNLNSTQLEALNQTQGAVLVTAGAGSGKTRILTHRIVHLIKNLNVAPENILAITFTNKATNEMRERIVEMLPILGDRVWISTFHSMCARILRMYINLLDNNFDSNFSIYSDTEIIKVINEILTERGINKDDKFKKTVIFHISNFKNNNLTYEDYENENSYINDIELIMSICKKYQKKLLENNAVDFDDLLILTYRLFKNFPDVLNKYSSRFKYVLVDEFQDTNVIQYELVKCLTQTHKNVFVVGDEDQCIYTWRGANFENIFKFKEDFENVKIFKLERNYRSTKIILDYANKLIKNNKNRIDKNLWSDINSEDTTVEKNELYNEQDEAEFVARQIYDLVHNHGYNYKDFAILMRLNALSFPFEEKLLTYNIPHKIYGGFKFYERAEIKNVLSYLKLFINPKDEQAFFRVINFPKRGLGETSIKKIKDEAQKNKISPFEVCLNASEYELSPSIINKLENFSNAYKDLFNEYKETSLDEFVIDVIDRFNIRSAYPSTSVEDTDKNVNIDQLITSIQGFYSKNKDVTLSDYIQNVSLVSDIDSLDDENNNVAVATVHSVKGLEFRSVFIIGLEEQIFPISRAFNINDEMEEERRLLYVGITRAKEKLFLTHCRERFFYGKRNVMFPSRFLKELGFTSESRENILNERARIFGGLQKKANYEYKNSFGSGYSKNYAKINSNVIEGKTKSQIDYVKNHLNKIFHNNSKINIEKYKVGNIVLHPKFGVGTIINIDSETKSAEIDFHTIGIKTLMLEIAPLKIVKD